MIGPCYSMIDQRPRMIFQRPLTPSNLRGGVPFGSRLSLLKALHFILNTLSVGIVKALGYHLMAALDFAPSGRRLC
jgi:hypothetical protein